MIKFRDFYVQQILLSPLLRKTYTALIGKNFSVPIFMHNNVSKTVLQAKIRQVPAKVYSLLNSPLDKGD